MERRKGRQFSVIAAAAVFTTAAAVIPTLAQTADWYNITNYHQQNSKAYQFCWDNFNSVGYLWHVVCNPYNHTQDWNWGPAGATTWIVSNKKVAGKQMCLKVNGSEYLTQLTMMECASPTGYHDWRWVYWTEGPRGSLWMLELVYPQMGTHPRCVGVGRVAAEKLVLAACHPYDGHLWYHRFRFTGDYN